MLAAFACSSVGCAVGTCFARSSAAFARSSAAFACPQQHRRLCPQPQCVASSLAASLAACRRTPTAPPATAAPPQELLTGPTCSTAVGAHARRMSAAAQLAAFHFPSDARNRWCAVSRACTPSLFACTDLRQKTELTIPLTPVRTGLHFEITNKSLTLALTGRHFDSQQQAPLRRWGVDGTSWQQTSNASASHRIMDSWLEVVSRLDEDAQARRSWGKILETCKHCGDSEQAGWTFRPHTTRHHAANPK